MQQSAFDIIVVPAYPEKPRESGITITMDYGLGLAGQEDLIQTGGWFIDLAKIAVGISRVLPDELLRRKIADYRQGGINPFPGGQFFEIAYLQKKTIPYFEACLAAGYRHVEISDNCIDLSPAAKEGAIRQAVKMGLTVLGEVGKKNAKSTIDELAADIQRTLDAGSWKVLVEAMELLDEEIDSDLGESLAKTVPLDKIIFETPSQWMKGVDFHTQVKLWKTLLAAFGPQVNIANVPTENVIRLITYRLGVGSDPTLAQGAYSLSQKGVLS